MRLFLFLALLSSPVWSCTDADFLIAQPNNIYNCPTGLNLSGAGINRLGDGNPDPLIINVTGDAIIGANIVLDGGYGGDNLGAFSPGGSGSSGGPNGGGFDGAVSEDGNPGATQAPDGLTAAVDSPCASGGGGASFATLGVSGSACATSATPVNRGQLETTEFDFLTLFRAGFAGAAGGLGDALTVGGGGGAGGALKIVASGRVIIASGVTISAKGGSGGDNVADGGGGGGGSGGAIWIIGTVGVTNNGLIDVTGGPRGDNFATGAHGGTGGDGRIRIEDGVNVSETSGTSTGTGTAASSRSSLKSDISCGTIAKSNDNKNAYQMMMGFVLILMLSMISKTLFRFRMKI